MLHSNWSVGILAFVGFFIGQFQAEACSCESSPAASIEENFKHSSEVFIGQVTRIETTLNGSTYLPQDLSVSLEINRQYKGEGKPELKVLTNSTETFCGVDFKVAQSYLVWTQTREDGSILTSICNNTRPVGEADEEIEWLEDHSRAN